MARRPSLRTLEVPIEVGIGQKSWFTRVLRLMLRFLALISIVLCDMNLKSQDGAFTNSEGLVFTHTLQSYET